MRASVTTVLPGLVTGTDFGKMLKENPAAAEIRVSVSRTSGAEAEKGAGSRLGLPTFPLQDARPVILSVSPGSPDGHPKGLFLVPWQHCRDLKFIYRLLGVSSH